MVNDLLDESLIGLPFYQVNQYVGSAIERVLTPADRNRDANGNRPAVKPNV